MFACKNFKKSLKIKLRSGVETPENTGGEWILRKRVLKKLRPDFVVSS